MSTIPLSLRTLNELDHARLRKLIPAGPAGEELADLLDNAQLLAPSDMPADVVTLNSTVLLEDASGKRELTLCYPRDADPNRGRISVLSPLGLGLLGLSVGAQAGWLTPQGQQLTAQLLALLYQPEASGEYLV